MQRKLLGFCLLVLVTLVTGFTHSRAGDCYCKRNADRGGIQNSTNLSISASLCERDACLTAGVSSEKVLVDCCVTCVRCQNCFVLPHTAELKRQKAPPFLTKGFFVFKNFAKQGAGSWPSNEYRSAKLSDPRYRSTLAHQVSIFTAQHSYRI